MLKVKKPAVGFILICVSLALAIVATAMFLYTFSVGKYTLSRWALTCSVLAVWIMILLILNSLFFGDERAWTGVLYALAVFLLIYGFMQFIQPCLSPIGFAFGAGDLNMGDTALNKKVAVLAVVTAVFYVFSAISLIVAAFFPAVRRQKGVA